MFIEDVKWLVSNNLEGFGRILKEKSPNKIYKRNYSMQKCLFIRNLPSETTDTVKLVRLRLSSVFSGWVWFEKRDFLCHDTLRLRKSHKEKTRLRSVLNCRSFDTLEIVGRESLNPRTKTLNSGDVDSQWERSSSFLDLLDYVGGHGNEKRKRFVNFEFFF